MNRHDFDAVVVGGGLAGVAAAIALAQAGLSTIQLAPEVPADRRTSALMMPSVAYLEQAGLIGRPEELGHTLTKIRIIDATGRLVRAPETLFDAQEVGLEAFGWNFPNASLAESFLAVRAKLANLASSGASLSSIKTIDSGFLLTLSGTRTITTRLLVGADGKKSTVRSTMGFQTRETVHSQAALVCDLTLERPLDGTSIEFHYAQGPFTLVPAGDNRANLVWIDNLTLLQQAQNQNPEILLQTLVEKSQHLFGRIEMTTPAFVFPLSTLSVDRAGAGGVVLVGDAAHAFPPIGAQGLNLGLRDIADLAAIVAQIDRAKPDWAITASTDYASRRAADLRRTGGMVDTLFRSLLQEMLPAQALRAGGLWALKLLPPLRRQAFAIGMGKR